ncbi:DUF3135 domain-containing protein [Methylophaga sp.]|uniref:DUF3135 domain-containing protein n=1 Tax=Methylophaga sp. TaxID=2024840 RepID=UPI003F696614
MAFDFDEWASLAKQDRLAFEHKRAATLQHFITLRAKTDDELRKLNGLQFKIDMLRRKHKTPLAACIAISNLLMSHVSLLANPDLLPIKDTINSKQHKKSCKLLSFPSQNKE